MGNEAVGAMKTTGLKISAVVPLYRVEAYLPELLQSLTAQEPGDYELEVVFVDDGSPDRSGEIAQRWIDESGTPGTVIHQENAGVSVARNHGLDAATGDWVTFPDSDDVLAADYFQKVAEFIRADRGSSVVSTRMLRLMEPDPVPHDVHALQFRFMAGNRRVPMDRYPDFFQLNVASAFFRRREIVDRGVRFRVGLHASEDALFVAEFLLKGQREPVLGLAADARYIYRRRASRDSAVDRFRDDPESYIGRFVDGYGPLMATAAESGHVPGWLQSMFLYECQWILPVQLTTHGYADVLSADERQRVLGALGHCARFLDEDRLFEYDATALPLESRLLLQLLADRDIPSWVGAYHDRDGRVDVPVAAGSRVEVHARDGAVDASRDGYVVPDYFGQQLLVHWIGRIPRGAHIVVDGETRHVVRRRWVDTPAQQRDRHRRVELGVAKHAIPAREHEVRVWKPIPGPGGERKKRMDWRVSLTRRRFVRAVKRLFRLD